MRRTVRHREESRLRRDDVAILRSEIATPRLRGARNDGAGELVRLLAMTTVLILYYLINSFPSFAADDFRYDSHRRRDPFVSSALVIVPDKQLDLGELRLEGIILDPSASSYVIVNGQIVREGESLAGYKLESIKSNQAVFTKAGQRFELILREDEEFIKTYLKIQDEERTHERR